MCKVEEVAWQACFGTAIKQQFPWHESRARIKSRKYTQQSWPCSRCFVRPKIIAKKASCAPRRSLNPACASGRGCFDDRVQSFDAHVAKCFAGHLEQAHRTPIFGWPRSGFFGRGGTSVPCGGGSDGVLQVVVLAGLNLAVAHCLIRCSRNLECPCEHDPCSHHH